jgi:hypothetical protein
VWAPHRQGRKDQEQQQQPWRIQRARPLAPYGPSRTRLNDRRRDGVILERIGFYDLNQTAKRDGLNLTTASRRGFKKFPASRCGSKHEENCIGLSGARSTRPHDVNAVSLGPPRAAKVLRRSRGSDGYASRDSIKLIVIEIVVVEVTGPTRPRLKSLYIWFPFYFAVCECTTSI